MRFVQIAHYRCDEWDHTSYVWAPDDWSEDDIEEAVERATKSYDEALTEWEKSGESGPQNPGYKPQYELFPDETIKEVGRRFNEAKSKYNAWVETRRKAAQSFSSFLMDEGFKGYYDHSDYDTSVYWGHQHGRKLDYRDKMPVKDDLRGPAYKDSTFDSDFGDD